MEDIGGGDVGQNLKKEGRQYGEVRGGGGAPLKSVVANSMSTKMQLHISWRDVFQIIIN